MTQEPQQPEPGTSDQQGGAEEGATLGLTEEGSTFEPEEDAGDA